MSKMSGWITAPPTDLEATVAEFKSRLPGWWYSICECHVSCEASCGPSYVGPAAHLLKDRLFDDGFHVDIPQPSSLAACLRNVMEQAFAAIETGQHGGEMSWIKEGKPWPGHPPATT